MERLEAIARGRVQMVMYRAHTESAARRLGLTGYVMNLPDGTVRVIAEGERAKLEELVGALKEGSWLSRVDSVDTTYGAVAGEQKPFSIRYE